MSGARRRRVVISNFDSPGNPHYGGGGAAVMELIAQRLSAEYEVIFLTAAHRGQVVRHAEFRYQHLPVGWAGPRGARTDHRPPDRVIFRARQKSRSNCPPDPRAAEVRGGRGRRRRRSRCTADWKPGRSVTRTAPEVDWRLAELRCSSPHQHRTLALRTGARGTGLADCLAGRQRAVAPSRNTGKIF